MHLLSWLLIPGYCHLAALTSPSFCTMDSYCRAPMLTPSTYPHVSASDRTLRQLIVITRHGDRTPYTI